MGVPTRVNVDLARVPAEMVRLQRDYNVRVAKEVSAVNNAAGVTITTAQMLAGYILRSGAAAVSDTTPTAAQIVAAFPNAEAGDVFEFDIINTNSGTLTIVAGSGVTLAGTTTIATANTRRYLCILDNVATPAVTVRGVGVFGN